MVWLIVASVIILLFLIILIAKITIEVHYRHKFDDDLLEIKVSVWKMRVYTFSAPLIKFDFKSRSIVVDEEMEIGGQEKSKIASITKDIILKDLRKMNEVLQHVAGLHKIIKRFLSRISVHELNWKSGFGIGDAAHTGQLLGTVWMLKGSIIGVIGNYMKMKQLPKVAVTPHFQGTISYTNLSCMFSFRVGHAILAGLMIVRHWKRRPKLFQSHPIEKTSNA
ncbi:DUF2953 domain-containing protein [Halalkalibacter urbisdiaboli]|uniref:DUF2953 domain-containing protein n=1 Tax=Halalkalibacter urbisdiaboli TaxID=1960589 RepID=UPI000B42D474|nr:DUF2953 domain-containing protein [Halalkalibacter urbisdiaboli]